MTLYQMISDQILSLLTLLFNQANLAKNTDLMMLIEQCNTCAGPKNSLFTERNSNKLLKDCNGKPLVSSEIINNPNKMLVENVNIFRTFK